MNQQIYTELYEHTEFTGAADSWLRSFLQFYQAKGQLTTTDNFVPRLKKFLRMKAHRKFRRDIRFTNDARMLEACRVAVRLRFVGFQNQSRAMRLFRLLAESSELPTGVYADFFLFAEQYDALLPGTVSSIVVAGFAVAMVSLLLIPEPIAALWVSLSTVSINLGIFGLMPFLGIRLDFVSMVTIIMSIGFCVDFSAHLAFNYSRCDDHGHHYHYSRCHNGNGAAARAREPAQAKAQPSMAPVEKMGNVLYAVGTPTCQSAATSLVGVSFLAHTESYIFRSFFKTTVLVISLGVLHGLVILPVLLTLAHQQRRRNGTGEEEKEHVPRQMPTVGDREKKGLMDKMTGHHWRRSNAVTNWDATNRRNWSRVVDISAPMCQPSFGFILPVPHIFAHPKHSRQSTTLTMGLPRVNHVERQQRRIMFGTSGTTISTISSGVITASLYSLNSSSTDNN